MAQDWKSQLQDLLGKKHPQEDDQKTREHKSHSPKGREHKNIRGRNQSSLADTTPQGPTWDELITRLKNIGLYDFDLRCEREEAYLLARQMAQLFFVSMNFRQKAEVVQLIRHILLRLQELLKQTETLYKTPATKTQEDELIRNSRLSLIKLQAEIALAISQNSAPAQIQHLIDVCIDWILNFQDTRLIECMRGFQVFLEVFYAHLNFFWKKAK